MIIGDINYRIGRADNGQVIEEYEEVRKKF